MPTGHYTCNLQLLARAVWRKRKGGYVRRNVRGVGVAIYQTAGSPVVANTSCSGALMSSAGSTSACILLPP